MLCFPSYVSCMTWSVCLCIGHTVHCADTDVRSRCPLGTDSRYQSCSAWDCGLGLETEILCSWCWSIGLGCANMDVRSRCHIGTGDRLQEPCVRREVQISSLEGVISRVGLRSNPDKCHCRGRCSYKDGCALAMHPLAKLPWTLVRLYFFHCFPPFVVDSLVYRQRPSEAWVFACT